MRIGFQVVVWAFVGLALVAAQDPDEPVRDGKWLYSRNCAGCHNHNGDGKGETITQLGLVARDFKQGGFAFGDSREQMKRTITSGIPGRSPMPSFKGVLSDEEMDLVIEHVRTLMPPRDDAPPKNTEMIVKDRPVIARGKLPPIAEGAKEVARGLLIGTPEGMTFEYDLENVRLLGVRLGRFANREDWGDRGGAYLKPLGQTIWNAGELAMQLIARPTSNPGAKPIGETTGILTSTWTRGSLAGTTYELRERSSGRRIAIVDESVSTIALPSGPGARRTWRCRTAPEVDVDLSFGFEHRSVPASRATAMWHLVDLGERGTDAILLTKSEEAAGPSEAQFNVTVFRVPKWSEELAAQLEKELGL